MATLVNFSASETALAELAPIRRGWLTATYIVASGVYVSVDGPEVRFPTPIRVRIEDGMPVEPVVMPLPTNGVCGVLWEASSSTTVHQLVRVTDIPDVLEVDFGALQDLDRESLQPSDEAIAAWQAAILEVRGLRDDTVGAITDSGWDAQLAQDAKNAAPVAVAAKDDAVTAKGEAESARDEAVAAKNAAEAVPAQVDDAMADQVGSGGAFDTKLSATIGAEVAPIIAPVDALLPRRGGMPSIYSLLTGTPDETFTQTTGNTENTLARVGTGSDRGWKLGKIGGGNAILHIDFPGGNQTPPAQAICIDLTISDASQFSAGNYIAMYTYLGGLGGTRFEWGNTSDYYTHKWTNNKAGAAANRLVNGRQIIRISADHHAPGGGPLWNDIHRLEFIIRSATTVDVTIHQVYLETPPKARMLVIADRGYKDFYDLAYPKLRAAGIPVTWAVDPGLFGSGTGQHKAMTEAEIHTVARENNNSISFHAWQGQVTEFLTAEQLQEDTIRCIKWLQRHGYSGRFWRAAFTQGRAPQWAAIEDMVLFARSGMDTHLRVLSPWPSIHPMKIPAQQIDNNVMTSNAVIDARFDIAQRTHGLILPFFHSVGPAGSNITMEKFDYWMGRAVAGIEDGWIEPVTMEQLFFEMGGQFTSAGGATLATWTDPDGTARTKRIY